MQIKPIILFFLLFHVNNGHTPTKLKYNIRVAPVPQAVKKLMACYPGFVAGYSKNRLILKDGSALVWDDSIKNKPFTTLLNDPDLKDMFIRKYTKGPLSSFPPANFDPGRVRNESFFLKMYGATEAGVKQHLTEIIWCPKLVGQKITVTKINGIDRKLMQISAELDVHPELQRYLTDIGGTFVWRKISGTNRQSMHSFGMTVDINTTYSDYWQWNCKCKNEDVVLKYENRIPQIIVDIFEKYGFIWGGKWYHYDTMHFEYRPELLD